MVLKSGIRPTQHYLRYHSDVEWDLVMRTVLSPNKVREERTEGRYTYVKRFKKFVVEVHAEVKEETVWIINAFKMRRR